MWQEPFRASHQELLTSFSPGAGAGTTSQWGVEGAGRQGQHSDTRAWAPGFCRADPRPLLAVPPTRPALPTGLLWRFEVNAFFFWPCLEACGILVPQPGVEAVPPALEA